MSIKFTPLALTSALLGLSLVINYGGYLLYKNVEAEKDLEVSLRIRAEEEAKRAFNINVAMTKAMQSYFDTNQTIKETHEKVIQNNTTVVEKAIKEGADDDTLSRLIYEGVVDSYCVGKENPCVK